MNIPQYSMERMHGEIQQELDDAVLSIVHSNIFVRVGKQVPEFEEQFADYVGRKYAVACGSGLDALYIMLMAYGIKKGDEVIVPSDTFFATALAVVQTGATPVFVEPDIETYNIDPSKIEEKINERTKALLPVHFYGQTADMDPIIGIANKHNLLLFEDASQAHGAKYDGRNVGTYGNAAAFSLFPGKNLGAFGDAGIIVTDDKDKADFMHYFGNYGTDHYYHKYCGRNSRMDEINASVLKVKLRYLDKWTENKRHTAEKYLNYINNSKVILPKVGKKNYHTWHIFAIRCQERERFQAYLDSKGIHTYIHYPVPMHDQPAFAFLNISHGSLPIAEEISNTEVSIPMWYGMTDEEITYVIDAINNF